MLFYKSPRDQKLLSPEERAYILDGQEKSPEKSCAKAGPRSCAAAISGRSPSRASCRNLADLQCLDPLYMATERHMNIKEIAMFAWLPFLAADIGCVLGGYLSPFFHKHLNVSLFTSRKLVMLVGSLP
jgi:ACS family hexuronate transporter-like MFS transporter